MLNKSRLAGLLLTLVSANVFAIPMMSASYNGHTYYLLEENTWSNSQNYATSILGGNLVTINDSAEDTWIWQTFSSTAKANENPNETRLYSMWIGLNDLDNNNTWEWLSGEAVTYTNWEPGQPQNHPGEDLSGISLGPWAESKWHDIINPSSRLDAGFGIVEVDSIRTVPEPATALLIALGLAGIYGIGKQNRLS